MRRIDFNALMQIKACYDRLSEHEYQKLREQVLAGDPDGAMRELRRLMKNGH